MKSSIDTMENIDKIRNLNYLNVNRNNLKNHDMKKTKSSKAFFALLTLGLVISSCGGSEIRGASEESYVQMDAECGCESANSESKRENIFNSKYKDKWVNYIGIIELIEDDVLSINTDLKGFSDVQVKFDNPKEIYDLKNGSYIAVKFVLREQGGCLTSYQGDLGKVISTDMVEIHQMMK